MALLNGFLSWFFSLNPITIMLIGWALLPFGLFLTALVGESRILQIGIGQSKMFFPGDFSIGIILAGLGSLYQTTEQIWSRSTVWSLVSVGIPLFVFLLQRLVTDAPRYARRSRYSPTKLYHDIVGYLLCAFLVTNRLVPEFIYLIRHPSSYSGKWTIIFTTGSFYLGCAVYDALHPKKSALGNHDLIPEDALMELRHPSDWQPIWETRKIQKAPR
ncbi:hypothetical protein IJ103_03880 [Candidatus Saccharibacteria bacterium]|nr:hypothetical protein [Candidatus Saccharibacteria bacterium]